MKAARASAGATTIGREKGLLVSRRAKTPSSEAVLASHGAQATSFLEAPAANWDQAVGPITASATSAAPPAIASMATAARRLRNSR